MPETRRTLLSVIALLLWLSLYFFCTYFIYKYNYGYGRERAYALLVLGVSFISFPIVWKKFNLHRSFSGPWSIMAVLLATFTIGLNAQEVIKSIGRSLESKSIPSDQTYAIIKAIDSIKARVNPYGTEIALPSHDLDFHIENIRRHPHCFDPALTPEELVNPDPRKLSYRIREISACAELRRESKSMGLKYGPVLMLAYAPFVHCFDQAGILIAHAFMFIGFMFLLVAFGRKKRMSVFAISLLLTLSMLPPDFAWCNLNRGHTDLLPTILVCWGLFLWRAERLSLGAAVLVGLSIASKSIPGLLYAPLFLRNRKEFLVLIGSAAICYLPFLIWDWQGLWNNLSYPFLLRYRDSTAWANYLSDHARLFLLLILAAGTAWAYKIFVERPWAWSALLNFILMAHLAAFLSSSVFHSNYMVFFYPVCALILVNTVKD